MSEKLTLFDLPSAHKPDGSWSCFSFNPWKTRAVLNYKRIPYETQWVEYPDLESTLKPLVEAHTYTHPIFGYTPWTCPTLRFADGQVVMESRPIAERIEQLYPSPPLHLENGFHNTATECVEATWAIYGPDGLLDAVTKCLPPRSAEHMRTTREKIFGCTLEQLKEAMGTDESKAKAEVEGGPLPKMRDLLTKNKKDEGPFILGSEPCYADFVAVALFEAFERVSPQNYPRIIGFDESFKKLHEACRPWLQRDN